MKLTYDRDVDILLIETSTKEPLDHAEHEGPIIAHLTEGGKLSVLEILHASSVLASMVKATALGEVDETPAEAVG